MSKSHLTKTGMYFKNLGLVSDWDFLLHLPIRYEDCTRTQTIQECQVGQFVQIDGKLHDYIVRPRYIQATFTDSTGHLQLFWFQVKPYILNQLKTASVQEMVRIRGQVEQSNNSIFFQINHPVFAKTHEPLEKYLTPIYPTTAGLKQFSLRKQIDKILKSLDRSDYLSAELRQKYNLMPIYEAFRILHRPTPDEYKNQYFQAIERLKFDELLAQQIRLILARQNRKSLKAYALTNDVSELKQRFVQGLGFLMTSAQRRVVHEIEQDLERTTPMLRLLQGDVGSGKTVVCMMVALKAIGSGAQVALMAPTEILAEQHYHKIDALMAHLGIDVALLTGRIGEQKKKVLLEDIHTGKVQFIVGTQAIIQKQVEFQKLGLFIVDEQHRFGVEQRIQVKHRDQDITPHQLNMSATPIPRTLALSYLADLDISVIDELPPGRTPIKTRLYKLERRDQVIDVLKRIIASGRQSYWVCPLIEESEALDLQNVQNTYEELYQALHPFQVGLLHGRLKAHEKEQVMNAFRDGQIQVLVSTTVIEVGVDVPNASCMIIEQAERFGLAQLHQLRGRVGRGTIASECILLYDSNHLSKEGAHRLRAMHETTDGFEIAKKDLEIRGAGEVLGLKQSGQELLKFVDFEKDELMISKVKSVFELNNFSNLIDIQAILKKWQHNDKEVIKM